MSDMETARTEGAEAENISTTGSGSAEIIGPDGEALSLDTLPPVNTSRWVVRRKAEVVAAVNAGLLTVPQACERYQLTLEELASWQRAVDREGMAGLRATRVQHYRQLHERQGRKA